MKVGLFATLKTSKGEIRVRLFSEQVPKTVDNFVGLANGTREWRDPRDGKAKKERYYDGTIFHRVIPEFMIQTGDPTGSGRGGPGYTFEDEVTPDLRFTRAGLLAMANAGPNTNGSQFFITEAPTEWLSGKHTIFGEVVSGMEVVNSIARAPRDASDRPREDIVLERVEITEEP